MPLNQDQQTASDDIGQFLMSDAREFSLSGPAGTGKTFMMHHIVNELLPEYERMSKLLSIEPVRFNLQLCATTNKAVEVLQESTGFPVATIHSFLGLKVFDDYKTGKTKISKTPNFKIHTNVLMFIDEASMIDTELHSLILESFQGDSKIIYLGDHCQMAPVNEEISPVYKSNAAGAKLAQPMRNSNFPDLMDLCKKLRHTVETLEFFELPHVPGVIDRVYGQQAQDFIDQTFSSENLGARALAFTNDKVQEYNAYVRHLRNYPDHFVKGENLVNNSVYELYLNSRKDLLRVEEPVYVHENPGAPYMTKFDDKEGNEHELEVYALPLTIRGCPTSVEVPSHYAHVREYMQYFKSKKDWTSFYKMKNGYPDLRMRDACTVYKSQGSTYDTVFMDLANIGSSYAPDQVARMLYVGASRAKSRLVLFGDLPGRYRGFANDQFKKQKAAA